MNFKEKGTVFILVTMFLSLIIILFDACSSNSGDLDLKGTLEIRDEDITQGSIQVGKKISQVMLDW